jgi:penicillin-binding protein 2
MKKLVLIFIVIGASTLYIFQLINLQLINSEYLLLSENNAILKRTIYPERGLIYDRNNKLIVANKPSYDLMLIPEKSKSFDTVEICNIFNVSKETLKIKIDNAKYFSEKIPSVIIRQISKEQSAIFQEKIWKFNGFFLQKKSLRDYKIAIAPNLLGYISEVNTNEVKDNEYYAIGEQIGRQGIEKSYENQLRGVKGFKYFQKDRFNRIIGSFKEGDFDKELEVAENLILTIDSNLQIYGEMLMKNKRGGIVAIEPNSGEVLTLVSAPSFNPNILVGSDRSKNFNLLLQDTINKPLFDRSLQAEYSPGSPFKVLNALIGLQENVISLDTKFNCDEGHFYSPGSFMACHCKKGTQNNLLSGIYNSCNSFFAKTYKKIINSYSTPFEGINNWNSHLKSFGLGSYLGYDLNIGRPGFIPDGNYYNYWYPDKNWGATNVISNSIGQGEILTTPIQMANFTAAIANRGHYFKPHFVKIKSKNIDSLYPVIQTKIDVKNFDIVIDGMYKVVEKGTAKIAKIEGIEVCGKTGTAENFIKINNEKTQLTDHSIFIAFAPKDNPKIAIAVFVENGYWGSRWAAPIASLMIEKYLNSEVKRPWLEKRMMEGSLVNEYLKPLTGKPFEINE